MNDPSVAFSSDAATGTWKARTALRGRALLNHPLLNKGTAFTALERQAFGLEGLVPPGTALMEAQVRRVYEAVMRKTEDLERYIGISSLQDRNETLFYRLLLEHLEALMPIVYTPTVGAACQNFSRIFRRPRGVWITPEHRGRIADVLTNAPFRDVRLIVVTDNERILGLGDQGAGGMGIPVGKLALYTAAAGIHPSLTLPISLDVGTDNSALLNDPLYIGHRARRLRGEAYDSLVQEFVEAVQHCFPKALLQWEDFKKANALTLLERYRAALPSFNDDIQGTAAVAAAAFVSASRISSVPLNEQRIVILGAGAAGIGIASLLRTMLADAGVSGDRLTRAVAVLDSGGLLVDDRDYRDAYKADFAWPRSLVEAVGIEGISLFEVVRDFKPTALIGTSGQPGVFNEDVVREMARHVARPAIFPFSNPTSLSEATPLELFDWTEGRALVATGSPFQPFDYDGATRRTSQGNNVYVFPGVGLGALVSEARCITDSLFGVAATSLAQAVTDDDLNAGLLLPPIQSLREVSAQVALDVARKAEELGLGRRPAESGDLGAAVEGFMWWPQYPELVPV